MDTHVRILGILYIIMSGLTLLVALGLMLVFPVLLAVGSAPADGAGELFLYSGFISAIALLIVLLAMPGFLAGFGLLRFRPWARILAIILGILNLLSFPLGTALGIYTLWVLFNRETELLFSPPRYQPYYE